MWLRATTESSAQERRRAVSPAEIRRRATTRDTAAELLRRPELVFRIDVEGSNVVVISQGIYPRRFDGAMSGFMTRDPAERARAALDACVAAVLAVEVGALPCRQLGLVGGSFRRWRECRHS